MSLYPPSFHLYHHSATSSELLIGNICVYAVDYWQKKLHLNTGYRAICLHTHASSSIAELDKPRKPVSQRSVVITGPLRAGANQLLIQTRAQVVLPTPDLMIPIAPAGNQACKQKAVEQQRIKGSAPAGKQIDICFIDSHL